MMLDIVINGVAWFPDISKHHTILWIPVNRNSIFRLKYPVLISVSFSKNLDRYRSSLEPSEELWVKHKAFLQASLLGAYREEAQVISSK